MNKYIKCINNPDLLIILMQNCYAMNFHRLLLNLPRLTHLAVEADHAFTRRELEALPETLELLVLAGAQREHTMAVTDGFELMKKLTRLQALQISTFPDFGGVLLDALRSHLPKLRYGVLFRKAEKFITLQS